MGRKEEMVKRVKGLMKDREHIRDIGVVAHIDHGKTTMSDNLIAGAGMMSEELAGKQLMLDFHDDEQERGITINAANISIVQKEDGEDHLINIIDTPGHVDFSGDVTRAMRAVDGVIVVVCAVEGIMPQTETVIRQALKEKVKPTLFINKVDRLINELQVSPEEMQEKFQKIIRKVNNKIEKLAPEDKAEEWKVSPEDGSVAFGSSLYNWATSVPYMEKSGVSFQEVYEHLDNDTQKELAKKTPLHEVILKMIIHHLPNPKEAQKYRIPTVWRGDEESEIGKAMINCDEEGPAAMMVTDITMDPHAGAVATGRLFSGKIEQGQKLKLVNGKRENKIQQVGVYMGAERVNVDQVSAGNIAAVTGLSDAFAGETVSDQDMEPFEEMKHFSEAVITKSIEAKNTSELPKLIEVLRQVGKEDPMIKVEINEETGEHLISGMGELHLEVMEDRIRENKGLDVETSPPIVVYRETVARESPQVEGKSPNRHNKFYIKVEPLEDEVYQAMKDGEITPKDMKDKNELAQKLRDHGMEKEETKKVWSLKNANMLIDMTKGIQALHETKELVIDAFEQAMEQGPLAEEKVAKVKVKLMDAKLHEDAIHRGPNQVYPAVREPIYQAMLNAGAYLLEPIQDIYIEVPQDQLGSASKEIQGRRGKIDNIEQEDENMKLIAKAPIEQMFGFSGDIRSATEGKALWSTEYAGYEKLPENLQTEKMSEIRKRKGLDPNPPEIK